MRKQAESKQKIIDKVRHPTQPRAPKPALLARALRSRIAPRALRAVRARMRPVLTARPTSARFCRARRWSRPD